jgi:hypothetical protein
VAGLILLIRGTSKLPGVGLVQAYVLNLGLLHWLAAALYLGWGSRRAACQRASCFAHLSHGWPASTSLLERSPSSR